jgi:phospholipid/cholesterol/gamma-HCH transport system permease protein
MRLIGRGRRAAITPPIITARHHRAVRLIGIGSLTVVLLAGLFTGMVLALNSGITLDQFGARSMVGRLISASMVKELGPVLTGLMVSGRVGSGIAAEIGSMLVTDQIAALRALGTDPVRKLVLPRVLAGLVMMPMLSVLATGIGMVGGWVVTVLQFHVASTVYWSSIVQGLYMQDVWMGLSSRFLGFTIARSGAVGSGRPAAPVSATLDQARRRRELGRGDRRRLHGHRSDRPDV